MSDRNRICCEDFLRTFESTLSSAPGVLGISGRVALDVDRDTRHLFGLDPIDLMWTNDIALLILNKIRSTRQIINERQLG